MIKKDFEELIQSIKEAGKIRRQHMIAGAQMFYLVRNPDPLGGRRATDSIFEIKTITVENETMARVMRETVEGDPAFSEWIGGGAEDRPEDIDPFDWQLQNIQW